MKKFFFFGLAVIVFIPIFAQANSFRECDGNCNPQPQSASVAGGGFILAGCRDARATNYSQYFTHDGGDCVYADGSRIPADSQDLIRGENGVPTGGTHSQARIEATEMRPVPDTFSSPTFVNGKVRVNPATLPQTFETLTCKNPLLNGNLSVNTPLVSFEVMKLQHFFKKRLKKDILVTGNYRAQTKKAVSELQKKQLKSVVYTTGTVDTVTRNLVNKLECQAQFEEFLSSN